MKTLFLLFYSDITPDLDCTAHLNKHVHLKNAPYKCITSTISPSLGAKLELHYIEHGL